MSKIVFDNILRKNPLPRTGEVLDAKVGGGSESTGAGGSGGSGLGILYGIEWWGKKIDNGVVTGDMTGVTSINQLLYFNEDGTISISPENALYPFIKIDSNFNLLVSCDVVAYADADFIGGLPVADSETYGLVKVDGVTIGLNSNGQLEVIGDTGGGGIDFTVGTGLNMSSQNVLSVKYGTTAGTACQGDDSRLSDKRANPNSLSWSGYNSGSYDGSAAKSFSIPSNTNQLTNGAGFIYDYNGNFTYLSGSGSSSKYLAGNGTFYTISHDEISGLSTNYVTIATTQIITGQKQFSQTILCSGDVVAYADSTYTSSLPVGTTTTYGLLKYDGTTIGKNSSGQLYVINSGSGGSGSTVSWGTTSNYTSALSVDGTSKTVSLSGHTHSQYLTSHQTIYSLTITLNGTAYTYTPNSSSKSITINTSSSSGSFTLASASFSSNILWTSSSSSYSIQIRRTSNYTATKISGNTINGLSGSSWSNGSLYLNWISSSVNVRIDSDGKIYSNTSQLTSDVRLKNIIGHEEDVLDRMLTIRPIRYKRIDIKNATEETGFGAQHFIGVFDNVCFMNEDSHYYGISNMAITAITWAGINELYTRFKPVESEVEVLKQKVSNLQDRLSNAYREIFALKEQIGGAA